MDINPLLQIPVTANDAHDWGLTAVAHASMVEHVEKITDRKSRMRRKRTTTRFAHVPDKLLRDIVTFSPEALYCASGGECEWKNGAVSVLKELEPPPI